MVAVKVIYFRKLYKDIFFVNVTKILGGKCKDKLDYKKCKKIMEAGKCENEKVAKKCKKTCDMCEDEGPKKSTIPNLDLFDILSSFSCWA